MDEPNWITSPVVTERDYKCLNKAHEYEKSLIKKGYRWIVVKNDLSILVQCDEDGNPTPESQKRIDKYKRK